MRDQAVTDTRPRGRGFGRNMFVRPSFPGSFRSRNVQYPQTYALHDMEQSSNHNPSLALPVANSQAAVSNMSADSRPYNTVNNDVRTAQNGVNQYHF
jgi:hypothetical protein